MVLHRVFNVPNGCVHASLVFVAVRGSSFEGILATGTYRIEVLKVACVYLLCDRNPTR